MIEVLCCISSLVELHMDQIMIGVEELSPRNTGSPGGGGGGVLVHVISLISRAFGLRYRETTRHGPAYRNGELFSSRCRSARGSCMLYIVQDIQCYMR